MDNLLTKERKERNQIKSKNVFNNLKADYFSQKVFNNLEKRKILYLLKYNKKIKKRINININDYKEHSELIELEIKPVNNKYGRFININENNKIYYHIYFNNSKEEIKRNYLNENEEINILI